MVIVKYFEYPEIVNIFWSVTKTIYNESQKFNIMEFSNIHTYFLTI